MRVRSFTHLSCLTIAAALATVSVARAEDFGTLTGRFVLDGAAPEAKPYQNITPECAAHKPSDESVTVGKENGIANVFVYSREKGLKVAPSYEASAAAEVKLDNKNCRFEPHATVLRTGQTLVIGNSDAFGHNSNIAPFKSKAENPLIPAGSSHKIKYDNEESLPTKVSCNIHPWMNAFVLIRKDPYAVVSGPDGKFEIKDLPVGKPIEFQFWHETGANLEDVKFEGGKTDSKGRAKITIKAGENNLGDIKLPIAALKK